jgi:hypothetical protein
MFGTSYTTLAIRKEDGNVPKRNEFPSAWLLGSVVCRTTTTALGTNSSAIPAVMNHGYNMLIGSPFLFKRNFAEAKGLVIRYEIEYSF